MYAHVHTAAGFESMLWQYRSTTPAETTMKRSAHRHRKSAELPIAWREAEYAALQAISADTCDDRVSEDIFDIDDERAEIDIIVHRMTYGSN